MSDRLQKVLADQGLASRREIEKWMVAGRITINGQIAVLGDKVDLSELICVDGKKVNFSKNSKSTRVILYNKPVGEISTRDDPEGRQTIFNRLPIKKGERWVSVGRLDINTSGLILFTNNGELANYLMHPSSKVEREYAVRVNGEVSDESIKILKEGVFLDDTVVKFSDIQKGRNSTGRNQWYYVVLMEGKNREVRRLWESQGYQVSRLKRVRFGNIFIPSTLKVGKYLEMSPTEVKVLEELLKK